MAVFSSCQERTSRRTASAASVILMSAGCWSSRPYSARSRYRSRVGAVVGRRPDRRREGVPGGFRQEPAGRQVRGRRGQGAGSRGGERQRAGRRAVSARPGGGWVSAGRTGGPHRAVVESATERVDRRRGAGQGADFRGRRLSLGL